MIALERASEIAADWAAYMKIDPAIFSVHVMPSLKGFVPDEALSNVPEDAHAWAATIGNADNTAFRIIVREDTPAYRLEHIIVHELVHVYSFSTVGGDERENMELLTDQCALLIQDMRALEKSP